MKVVEGQKHKKNILLGVAVFVLLLYSLFLLVRQQSEISRKEEQLAQVKQQIQIQEIQNEDIKSAVNSGEKENGDYIERAAREGLGFSKPGERVFVNIAGK
ncbi:MAG: septum formation initiator family protein [Oscillospiraceae bacterium]|jgi:cell division protein DivIC|nr:septum formation initiator family protein [Oscillospiraceae bacterium]